MHETACNRRGRTADSQFMSAFPLPDAHSCSELHEIPTDHNLPNGKWAGGKWSSDDGNMFSCRQLLEAAWPGKNKLTKLHLLVFNTKLPNDVISTHQIALIKLDASFSFSDVMFRVNSYIWSMLKPSPDMCWKNACFSTCTVMLFTPTSLNMAVTCVEYVHFCFYLSQNTVKQKWQVCGT